MCEKRVRDVCERETERKRYIKAGCFARLVRDFSAKGSERIFDLFEGRLYLKLFGEVLIPLRRRAGFAAESWVLSIVGR